MPRVGGHSLAGRCLRLCRAGSAIAKVVWDEGEDHVVGGSVGGVEQAAARQNGLVRKPDTPWLRDSGETRVAVGTAACEVGTALPRPACPNSQSAKRTQLLLANLH